MLQYGISACGGLADGRTGLQRHIEGTIREARETLLPCLTQSHHLRMVTTPLGMKPLRNYLPATDQHGTDSRIRTHPAESTGSELDRPPHEDVIVHPDDYR